MTWKPGESGNLGGSPGPWRKPFWDALRRICLQEDGVRIREAAEKLLAAAANGEPWAIQALADRTDGKPKQQTEISGPDGEAIPLSGTVTFVKPDGAKTNGSDSAE